MKGQLVARHCEVLDLQVENKILLLDCAQMCSDIISGQ